MEVLLRTLIYLIVTTLITGVINIFFSIWSTSLKDKKIELLKNELKKKEIRFLLYNEMQIKALSKLYQLLVDFQKKTILIKESNEVSVEKYKNLVQHWIIIYIKCSDEFSKEKYILPKEIKYSYSALLGDFRDLMTLINYEKQFKNLFYINEIGETELGGDYKDLDKISSKLKELNRTIIMSNSIQKTSSLREEIEKYFEEKYF